LAPPIIAAAAGGIAGAMIGSFIATLVLRWGAGDSVIAPRSRCDVCGATLSLRDLVPILSWALGGGKCRRCAAHIDPLHPAIELASAVIGAAAAFFAPTVGGIAHAILGWQLLTLGLLDARHYWLPHRLSLLLLVTGITLGGPAMTAVGLDASLIDRLVGAVAGFAALTAIAFAYRGFRGREGLGGGDPPMFAGIGAWLGWQALPLVLLFAALAGIAVALAGYRPGNNAGWATQRAPLGTLMALAVPFVVVVLTLLAK
jgi:leader peptidase (prepilin peptidase) / N-methyltransferase